VLFKTYSLPHDAIVLILVPLCVLFGWRIHVRFEKPLLTWLTRLERRHFPRLT
jgi:exopolysaccharide production protein ExoZ